MLEKKLTERESFALMLATLSAQDLVSEGRPIWWSKVKVICEHGINLAFTGVFFYKVIGRLRFADGIWVEAVMQIRKERFVDAGQLGYFCHAVETKTFVEDEDAYGVGSRVHKGHQRYRFNNETHSLERTS